MVETLLVARVVMFAAGLAMLGLAVWIDRHREAPALRPFVLFVVEYYGLPHLASPARKVAFLLPAVAGVAGGTVLVISPSAAGSMAGGGPTASPLPSVLGLAAIAEQSGIYYAGGVMLAGVALLVSTVANYEHLDGRLGVVLSFVAVWPWLGYFLTPGIVGDLQVGGVISLTAGGYVLSTGAVAFAVTRGSLFEAAPAAGTLGPETVLSDLEDAVVVVDHDRRVVQVNDAAVETFGIDSEVAIGRPLSDSVGTDVETLRDEGSVELTVPEGTRHFEASVSPVRDRYDRQPGHAIVITDVTRERVRSQRLTVLNRVLRHNLRNGMNNIIGRAELIADSNHDHADHAETILTSATDLMSLSDRARQVQEMLSATPEPDREVELANLATVVLDTYREEYPGASLSVDIDDSLGVSADSRTLSGVLDNLVENALVHNDAPTPVVTISARRTDDGVRLSISDNGPGIPEHERALVESGEESALEHGSGLGLWAVKWGVVRLGGDLELRDNEPQGTVVSIELPDASEPESTVPETIEAA